MNQIITRLNRTRLVRPLLAAAIGLTALVAVGAPASAHERDHGRDWRAHEWRHDDWRWHRPVFGAFAPAPVYVPRPVYAPAPVYEPYAYAPPASFNIVVPLRFH